MNWLILGNYILLKLKFCNGTHALDFPDKLFDVAIFATVIEHVPNPKIAVSEVDRTLKQGRILALTSTSLFWEHLATMVNHLKDRQHNKVMTISQLSDLIKQSRFMVLNYALVC